jgi:hypothetical protein
VFTQKTDINVKKDFDLTSKSMFSTEDDVFPTSSVAALLAKNAVPVSHKKSADNYRVIKKVFKFQAVVTRLSTAEKALLDKYDFAKMEFTTAKQMADELSLLQKWAYDENLDLRAESQQIFDIRLKELKNLSASRYAHISNEIYKGYMVFENYLKEISRFRD